MLADLMCYGSLVSAFLFTGLRLFFAKPFPPIIPFPSSKTAELEQGAEANSLNA
jgi:hypothetical protein